MNETPEPFDPFDPTGMLKTLRSDTMEVWAKTMIDLVNTDAYARLTGRALDAWLSTSAPLRRLLETTMTQTLANLQMPSRDEITRLAGRLTNIEMRLDDLDAKLDSLAHLAQPPAERKKAARTSRPPKPRKSENG
jgi:hypothetical protein